MYFAGQEIPVEVFIFIMGLLGLPLVIKDKPERKPVPPLTIPAELRDTEWEQWLKSAAHAAELRVVHELAPPSRPSPIESERK